MRRILFLLIALVSCENKKEVVIVWENDKAVAVTFPTNDSPVVSVAGSEYSVLGDFVTKSSTTTFTPAVQFERGQTYDIFSGKEKLFSFTVPIDSTLAIPQVVINYPSCDTVPENLLKIYIVFDQPMMEGRSSQYVHLLNNDDTVKGAFLDLQPELWSEDQTTLTLWLDPGRIKQDLIPNKNLGAVLDKNMRYRLHISPGWKSKSGQKTTAGYDHNYLTKEKDSRKPDVTTWTVTAENTIVIDTKESLDWSLLNSTLSVWRDQQKIEGNISIEDCDRRVIFTPKDKLPAGKYALQVESRLEDLAGNNLNRLFETDVTNTSPHAGNKSLYTVEFIYRP